MDPGTLFRVVSATSATGFGGLVPERGGVPWSQGRFIDYGTLPWMIDLKCLMMTLGWIVEKEAIVRNRHAVSDGHSQWIIGTVKAL